MKAKGAALLRFGSVQTKLLLGILGTTSFCTTLYVLLLLFGVPATPFDGVLALERKQAAATLAATANHTQAAIETWVELQKKSLGLLLSAQQISPANEASTALGYPELLRDYRLLWPEQRYLTNLRFIGPGPKSIFSLKQPELKGQPFSGQLPLEQVPPGQVRLFFSPDAQGGLGLNFVGRQNSPDGNNLWIVLSFDWGLYISELQEKTLIGRTGEMLTVNRQGWILNRLKYPLSNGNRPGPLEHRLSAKLTGLASQGSQEVAYAPDYRGVAVFAVPRTIQLDSEQLVRLVVKQDEAEAFPHRAAIIWTSVWLAVVVVSFAILLALWGARSLTRPLQRLSRAVTKVETGHWEVELPAPSNDEVGQLVRAFTRMLETLRDRGELLESKVLERTAQLEAANQELQREFIRSQQLAELLDKTQRIVQVGSWQMDLKNGHQVWSDEQYRLLGYDPEQTPAGHDSFLTRMIPKDQEKLTWFIEQFIEGFLDHFAFKIQVQLPGDVNRVLALTAELERDGRGFPKILHGTALDVTETERSKAQLEYERERAKRYFETAGVVMIALDLQGRVTEVNQMGCRVLAGSREEIIGRDWFEVFWCGEDVETGRELLTQALDASADPAIQTEYTVRTLKGSCRLIRWYNSALLDWDGRISGLLSSGEDITETRRIEKALFDSEEKLRNLLEASHDGIISVDSQGQILLWNQGAEQMFGQRREEISRLGLRAIIPPRFRLAYWKLFKRALEDPLLWKQTIELQAQRADGEEFPVELSASKWEHRGQWLFSGVVRDITRRREIESEQRALSQALDSISEILFIIDGNGNLHYTNRAYKTARQTLPEEFMGSIGLTEQPEQAKLRELTERFKSGRQWRGEVSRKQADGSFQYYQFLVSPIFGVETGGPSFFCVGQDVTEAKRDRAKLVQTQKLEALGTLSSGVAHEINNPIGYIYANVQVLSNYLKELFELLELYQRLAERVPPGDREVGALIEQIEAHKTRMDLEFILEDTSGLLADTLEGAERVKAIVQDLGEFARFDHSQIEQADLNEMIQKTLRLARNEVKYKCEVVLNLGDLPKIWCRIHEINQVLLNLLVNAVNSIPEQGEISISSGTSKHMVWVKISDSGTGIDPQVLPHIFEPFFTTKEIGRGTGLGLSVSQNIVSRHGGQITVDSSVGQGSTFTVWLPIEQPEPAHEQLSQG